MKMKELWEREEKRRKEGHNEDWEGEVCGAQWKGPESPIAQGEWYPKNKDRDKDKGKNKDKDIAQNLQLLKGVHYLLYLG